MNDIVRTWKDETNRQGLSVEEQAALPANPAGEINLTDEELEAVYGAWGSWFDDDITNTNSNTATSSSTSSAFGGSATSTGSPITLSLGGLSI
jgi:mersacidin/lichenicidin family type 2 lantibiotic